MDINEFKTFWYSEALFIQSNAFSDNSHFYDYDLLLSASILEHNNIVVKYIKNEKLFDFAENTRKAIIRNYNPKVIFISVNLNTVYHALNLCKEIKNMLKIPLVAISPDLNNDILMTNFDFVITGANEYSALDLYNLLALGNGSFENIPGLIYQQNGKMIENSIKTKIPEEILKLDISFSDPYYSTFYYSSRVYDGFIKYISAERVVNEIKEIAQKFFIRHLIIADKNFMSDYKRLNSICSMLSKNDLNFKISCIADLDILHRYPNIINNLAKANISVINMKIDEKQFSKAQKVIKNITSQENISIFAPIIIGDPKKTIDDFEKTFDYCKEMTILGKGFFLAFPAYFYPEKLNKNDICVKDDCFVSRSNLTTFESKNFSREQLYNLHNKFTKEIIKLNDNIFKNVTFDTLCFYHNLSEKYGITTIMQRALNATTIKQYLSFFEFASFSRIESISLNDIDKWIPFRVLSDIQYIMLKDGYKLPGYGKNIFIKNRLEIAVYEYSSGKLNIGDIAQKICEEFKLNILPESFVKKTMVPFYKKLEKHYQIIFYR